MSKRGNGEGSITKRQDGRWMGRVTVPGIGRKTVYGKTRKEVAEEIAKMLGVVRQGLPLDDKTTVREFLTRWLEDSARPSLRPRTFEGYKHIVDHHLIPALGMHRLHKLAAADVQRLYRAKLQSGLSPATVIRIHAVLHRAIDQAVRWNMVVRNVAGLVDRPKLVKHEIRPLNAEQCRALLEEAKGTRFEALIVLALTTGMRQGEILGLRWQDVDIEVGRVYVRQIWDGRGKTPDFGPPKTQRSSRGITLTALAVQSLRTHRVRQSEERLRAGAIWEDFGLVFASEVGTPLDPHNFISREFKPLLREAGLPAVRFHDLRHSAATLLLSQNVHPKKVQELLGHSQIRVTLDVYSHVLPGLHDEAADQMDRLLGTG